jgi:hypothetical protein
MFEMIKLLNSREHRGQAKLLPLPLGERDRVRGKFLSSDS